METSHNQIVSFIWSIADDVLRDVFLRGQYRDVILPKYFYKPVPLRTLEENERDILELDRQSQGFIQSLFNLM